MYTIFRSIRKTTLSLWLLFGLLTPSYATESSDDGFSLLNVNDSDMAISNTEECKGGTSLNIPNLLQTNKREEGLSSDSISLDKGTQIPCFSAPRVQFERHKIPKTKAERGNLYPLTNPPVTEEPTIATKPVLTEEKRCTSTVGFVVTAFACFTSLFTSFQVGLHYNQPITPIERCVCTSSENDTSRSLASENIYTSPNLTSMDFGQYESLNGECNTWLTEYLNYSDYDHYIPPKNRFDTAALFSLMLEEELDQHKIAAVAARYGALPMLKLLFRMGFELKESYRFKNKSPLYRTTLCREKGCRALATAKYLLEKGANPNDAIRWASFLGHVELVELLLATGQVTDEEATEALRSATYCLEEQHCLAIARLILQYTTPSLDGARRIAQRDGATEMVALFDGFEQERLLTEE